MLTTEKQTYDMFRTPCSNKAVKTLFLIHVKKMQSSLVEKRDFQIRVTSSICVCFYHATSLITYILHASDGKTDVTRLLNTGIFCMRTCPLRRHCNGLHIFYTCSQSKILYGSWLYVWRHAITNGPVPHLLADFFIMTSQSNGPSQSCAIVTSQ